jgi:pyruvate dehydrogenase E2 component (dihydrolipoamide acetyltransferase)
VGPLSGDAEIQLVTMPKWGLAMIEGTIVEWRVREGETVQRGRELVEIETQKTNGVMEAVQDGLLRRIVAEPGSEVPVGATIAILAPAEVPDERIDEVVAEARARIASGDVGEIAGPQLQMVEVDGRTFAAVTVGEDDEVVLLVHGYGGDKGNWMFVQEPLAEERRVLALDLPGHGGSDKEVQGVDLDGLAALIWQFLDAAEVPGGVHLVGHSLGGAIVAAAAAAAPGRVRSVTLVAPLGFGSPPDAEYLRGFATATSRRELKPLLGRLYADESLVTRQMTEDLLRYKRVDGVTAALGTLCDVLLDGDRQAIDVRPLLSGVTAPVMIVWGTADRILPPVEAATVGDAELRLVEGAGHMVHVERPQTVIAAVRDAAGLTPRAGKGSP